jgi:uncharacterized protein (DUF433 family)
MLLDGAAAKLQALATRASGPAIFHSMATKSTAVHCDPDILGGKPVFVGTRVPFQTLVDYVAAGHTLDQFLDHFPTVSREQALAALEDASDRLKTPTAR